MFGTLLFASALISLSYPERSYNAQSRATPADSQAVFMVAVIAGANDLYSPGITRSLATELGERRGSLSAPLATQLATAIGAKAVRTEDVVRCTGGPESCRISAGTELLRLGLPVFSGDSAFVQVTVHKPSTSVRSPVTMRGKEYVVVRRGSAWVVTAVRVESAS
jgi:hypothetical protein